MPPSDTGPAPGWEALLVDPASAGIRIDRWLADRLGEAVSRSRVRAMIEAGEVLLDGQPAEPSRKLAAGQRVEWRESVAEPVLPAPEAIPLTILYEDAELIVIDKPAGLVVHPGAGNRSGTLVNALLHHTQGSLSTVGGKDRPGIVHRIDKDTSGVMVAARTDEAHRVLAAAFADHGRTGMLERSYLALVWGNPDPASGVVRATLGRAADRVRRAVVRSDAEDARPAVTHYRTVERMEAAALLECRLETGRTHQIRVHMAHIGHPVIGDPLYGRGFASRSRALPQEVRSIVEAFPRQALHAARLDFPHPADGRLMRFESPIPVDMEKLLAALRNK